MRNLLELSSDVYWEQDREFRFTHFSAADPGVAAALRQRMLGKRRWELAYSNVSAAQWRAHRALLAAGKPFRDLELCSVDEGGELSWASASGAPVLGRRGEVLGYYGVRRDITQRKRDEALIALEHSVARALAGAEDGAAGVQAVLQAVCELQGWPVGRYFVADDEAGVLRFSAAWGARATEVRQYIGKSRSLVYRRGEGLSGCAWESGEPLWVRDVTADPRASGSARLPSGERLRRGALVVPVKVEARTLGVLSFASNQPRQPDARLLSSLDAIGVQLGQFVQRKDTEAKLRRDEEALRRFRAAIDMTADAIFLTERSSMRFVDVNQITCQRLGYSREQLLQMGPQDIFARPRAALEASFDQIIATGGDAMPQEMSYRSANGEQRWAELHRQASRAGDGWIIVTVARDITDRRLAEQKSALNLRRQERIARFGQEAIGERDPAALVQGAVQTVLEALDAEAVGYVERGPRADEAVLRTVVGAAGGTGAPGVVPVTGGHPIAIAFANAAPAEVPGGDLGLRWASGCPSVALVPVPGEQGARAVLCVGHREAAGLGAEELNFVGAVASVLSTALQRIDSETRLSYLAQFDALTGLPNRALLLDRFSQAIAQAGRHGKALAVLFIDLDEFKAVNDTLGHAAGDELLKAVAERLRQSVRAGDTVARIAGDEFAVLLAELSRADDAALVAQKIVARLGEPITLGGQEALVTASIGVATFPNDGQDCEALLAAADAAMYRAKQSGRNMYQFFTADLNVRLRARVQTIAELRRALERGELEVHYQPKFDLARRVPAGAEALLRWRHPLRGLTPPAEFIPVLEESGLIVPAGEWVLEQACRDLKESLALGLPALPVAVNLSARQFRQQDLAARLRRIVESVGLPPGSIDLEITESQLVQDAEHAIAVMRELREAGIGVAIDDFGTGYSSLSYLTRFPVSALKIDRSFVARSLEEQRAAAIVHAIVDLAHTLGFTVIAEGIETEPQAAFLLDLGCDQGQGYLFARPQPIAQLRELLRSRASAVLQA